MRTTAVTTISAALLYVGGCTHPQKDHGWQANPKPIRQWYAEDSGMHSDEPGVEVDANKLRRRYDRYVEKFWAERQEKKPQERDSDLEAKLQEWEKRSARSAPSPPH